MACRPILAVIVDRWPFPEEGQTARQRRRHKIWWYHPLSQALDMGLVPTGAGIGQDRLFGRYRDLAEKAKPEDRKKIIIYY